MLEKAASSRVQALKVVTPALSVLIGEPKRQRIPSEDEREYLVATNILNPDETFYLVY